eukprot:3317432-Rhodomonas_salina.1
MFRCVQPTFRAVLRRSVRGDPHLRASIPGLACQHRALQAEKEDVRTDATRKVGSPSIDLPHKVRRAGW